MERIKYKGDKTWRGRGVVEREKLSTQKALAESKALERRRRENAQNRGPTSRKMKEMRETRPTSAGEKENAAISFPININKKRYILMTNTNRYTVKPPH